LHNFPDREWFLPGRHFFMAPPGKVASPFFVHGARSSRALRLINEAAGGKIGLVLASGVTQANLIPARPAFRLTINSPGVCLLSNAHGLRVLGDRHSLRPLSFLMEPVSMSLGEASRGNWDTPGCHSSAQAGDRGFQRQQ
jgi:hypothetical protein